jgi:hypothetical protein
MLRVRVVISLESFPIAEKGMWLCKKKSIEKNGQVSEISKTMGTQMPAIKKEKERKKKERNEKDSPWSLAKVFSSFKQERYDSRSIVELG